MLVGLRAGGDFDWHEFLSFYHSLSRASKSGCVDIVGAARVIVGKADGAGGAACGTYDARGVLGFGTQDSELMNDGLFGVAAKGVG